jgi:glucan phosphoethanolaminetransferase (alkaline phosphatase superfamily)
MDESKEPQRPYRWPWLVLAAFLLFVLLAIIWVSFEIRTVRQERNLNVPSTTNSEP